MLYVQIVSTSRCKDTNSVVRACTNSISSLKFRKYICTSSGKRLTN